MARKIGHAIHDILETIERIESKTRGRTFAEFVSDWELRFIVRRAIEVIRKRAGACLKQSRRQDRKSSGAALPG
jgi:uncharacterized protein with HEPN domain